MRFIVSPMLLLISATHIASALTCQCNAGHAFADGSINSQQYAEGCSPIVFDNCTCENGVAAQTVELRQHLCETHGKACVGCSVGYELNGFGCLLRNGCNNGVSNDARTECVSCDDNYELIDGACVPCRDAEMWIASTRTCNSIFGLCQAGHEFNGTRCIDCAAGKFKDSDDAGNCAAHTAIDTLTCGPGTFRDSQAASAVSDVGCTACPHGKYQDTHNQSACINHTTCPEQAVGVNTPYSTVVCENFTTASILQQQTQLNVEHVVAAEPAADSTTIEPLSIAIGAGSVALIAGALMACKRSSEDSVGSYDRLGDAKELSGNPSSERQLVF